MPKKKTITENLSVIVNKNGPIEPAGQATFMRLSLPLAIWAST